MRVQCLLAPDGVEHAEEIKLNKSEQPTTRTHHGTLFNREDS